MIRHLLLITGFLLFTLPSLAGGTPVTGTICATDFHYTVEDQSSSCCLLRPNHPPEKHVPPKETAESNAFRRSSVGLERVSVLLADDGLNQYWRQAPGLSLFWRFPFYIGEMELRGSLLPLRADRQDLPDLPHIHNVLTTLGWGVPVAISERIHLTGSIRVGNNFMYRPAFEPLDRPESEFMAGVSLMAHYRLSNRFGLRAGLQHDRVFTFHRMDLTMASIGLEIHFNTPLWIVRFLQ